MRSAGKVFGNMCSEIREETGGLNFLVGVEWRVISNTRGKFKIFDLKGNPPSPSLSGKSLFPHKENHDLGLLTV